MKTVSEEHFERMKMMCQVFERNSKTYADSFPEFQASNSINDLIEKIANPTPLDFERILSILTDVDSVQHMNGSQWYDYKIHVMATLRANGYKTA